MNTLKDLLYVFDDRVLVVGFLGWGDIEVRVLGQVKRKEVVKALYKMKCGKVVEVHCIAVEFLMKGERE